MIAVVATICSELMHGSEECCSRRDNLFSPAHSPGDVQEAFAKSVTLMAPASPHSAQTGRSHGGHDVRCSRSPREEARVQVRFPSVTCVWCTSAALEHVHDLRLGSLGQPAPAHAV